MKSVKVKIEGMTCSSCENHITKELQNIGAKKIKVSHKDKSAEFNIEDDVTENLVKDAVKTAGYEPGKIVFSDINKGLFRRLFK